MSAEWPLDDAVAEINLLRERCAGLTSLLRQVRLELRPVSGSGAYYLSGNTYRALGYFVDWIESHNV